MARLKFIPARPVPAHPLRADIALFVGFVESRRPDREPVVGRRPVAVDCWDDFDHRFAWDERLVREGGPDRCDTYLGAAVRSFFTQGGRKCWVVSAAAPFPVQAARGPELLRSLLPGYGFSVLSPETWSGIAHVLGLPEVSFLCLPDLPDVFAGPPAASRPRRAPAVPERFLELGSEPEEPRAHRSGRPSGPRCDAAGFRDWAAAVDRVGGFLRTHAREVQFVGAIPRPTPEAEARRAAWAVLRPAGRAADGTPALGGSIGSAFVQLAWPWLRLEGAGCVPEALEPPDGVLAGLLSGNALMRGTFRVAAGLRVRGLRGTDPELGDSDLAEPIPPGMEAPRGFDGTLEGRVSVFGPTPGGWQLRSDVTTSVDEAYRPANVNRLVAAIVRAARLAGETAVFGPNGEALWGRLRESLESFLADLWRDGALDGETPQEAFEVRCDRSTMTQGDLDSGRTRVLVRFTAAAPIVEIQVVLGLDEGGQVSLIGARSAEMEEAA